MTKRLLTGLALTIAGWIWLSMTPLAQSSSMPKDGILTVPTDYASFPIFLKGIQKPNAVRDIYINTVRANPIKASNLRMD